MFYVRKRLLRLVTGLVPKCSVTGNMIIVTRCVVGAAAKMHKHQAMEDVEMPIESPPSCTIVLQHQ